MPFTGQGDSRIRKVIPDSVGRSMCQPGDEVIGTTAPVKNVLPLMYLHKQILHQGGLVDEGVGHRGPPLSVQSVVELLQVGHRTSSKETKGTFVFCRNRPVGVQFTNLRPICWMSDKHRS